MEVYDCQMSIVKPNIFVRWPLHCRERWKTIPFRLRNPRAEDGQLDYELARRDQKMVGDFYKVPRKTKIEEMG